MVFKRRLVYAVPAVLVILSLACSLPGLSPKPTPESATPVSTEVVSGVPQPTSTPQPLPPALVETYPAPGSEIPLSQPITLYFNQAMDRSSVQAALSGQPALAGSFSWDSDTSLTFVSDAPFLPETELTITLSEQAHSRVGMALLNPLSISYRTTGYLKLTQALPDAGAKEVDPTSAVVVAFNRPVVALGAGPADLPAGFQISSASGETPAGRGEWTNTATYIFYPDPGLAGGVEYSVSVDPSLTGVDGAPLEQDGEKSLPLSWSFTTALPRLISVQPDSGSVYNGLDRSIVLTFSQAMDPGSFTSAFRLQDAFGRNVPGEQTWSEDVHTFTFVPSGLLSRGSQYTVVLDGTAQAAGGTPLGQDVSQTFFTVSELSIYGSSPEAGSTINPTGFIELYVTSFLPVSTAEEQVDLTQYFSFSPQVSDLNYYFDTTSQTLRIFGSFKPDTDYTLTVSASLPDQWGGRLGTDYVLPFRTGPLDPNLSLTTGTDIFFMTPQENTITVQATNLSQVPISMGSVPLEDFILMAGMSGYDIRTTYQPVDQVSWTEPISVTRNKMEAVQLPLSPEGASLSPGLYYVKMDPLPGKIFATPYLAVVSNLNITFKLSPSDAAVWVVDLRTGEPGANLPVTIYDENGVLQVQGETDASGLFHGQAGPFQDSYSPRFAVIGEPGQDSFGLAVSTWGYGLEPGNFGLPSDFQAPGLKTYIYTDRPIYRPGQTVYFRVVARDARNGRYAMPQVSSVPLVLYDDMGQVVTSYDLPLSAFGTAHGQYDLPADARPGYYRLGEYPSALNFAVAEYRKPEINLSVKFAEDQVMAGQPLNAEVNARYFFDAPASNVHVQWSLYVMDTFFDLPGYTVGESSFSFFDMFRGDFVPELGQQVDSGETTTDPNGLLSLTLTPPEDQHPGRKLYTLEVTLKDESGLYVSARGQVVSNPAPYYIGIRPGQWFGRAGTPLSFDIQTVKWDGSISEAQALLGKFDKVTWVRDAANPVDLYGMPNYVKKVQNAGSVNFTTGADGRAVLSFTAEDPGTYELKISGDGTASSVMVWVGGEGQVLWPELPNQRLTLTAGQTSYRPGDTAGVFIPNPFGSPAQALISVERGETMRMEVIDVPAVGLDYQLPLTLDDAPNIYLSVTLLGNAPSGNYDFRQGYVELKVDPSDLELNVQIAVQPEKAGPGDDVTLAVRITDSAGQPVQGEFSLAVADLAALMLAEPNSVDIRAAFYGDLPLSVKTGLDLAVSTRRFTFNPGGMGGGGGAGAVAVARENFPDTAYWNPQVVTDANGEAVISLTLPDTLTTWKVDVRGLTAGTQVGEASSQLITSKELLVRPVTPRFLVAGDRVLLAAVVQNNTADNMDTAVALQASGVVVDDSTPVQQQIVVPAGGRARVEWWVKVQDVESVDLVFSAVSGNFQDASRPAGGKLPVIGYSAPQAFATSGTLDGSQDSAGLDRMELISLPRTFDPRSGELKLELSPSLGAALIRGLDALEQSPYESTEQILSRFLPNLETYRALSEMGIDSPDLQARLDRTLQDGLSRLVARQNDDGGWGWWQRASGLTGSNSDPYITSYVLYGLARCQQEGIAVNQSVIDKGIAYLGTSLPGDYDHLSGDDLDRLAFEVFVLGELSQVDVSLPGALYDRRDQLSPWAQSFIALSIDKLSPGDERVQTLISDIQGLAVRSGAGVHWEDRTHSGRNYTTPVTGSAIVVYTLSRLEPASTLIPDAVRYLMANRNPRGGWNSSYETAWVTLSILEVMKGTGEWTGSYDFNASLNGAPFASGQAAGAAGVAVPVYAAATIDHLYPDSPNALVIHRDVGDGRLYYTAYLDIMQPVDTVAPLNRGVVVERSFYLSDCTGEGCQPVNSAAAGQSLQVRVTVVLPHDAYNLILEDYIPAGSEVLDTSLKTSQLGEQLPLNLDPGPSSMGWWYFQGPRIYDDHVAWAADFLPAGTYELTYTLVLLQPGEYRVVPARAWEFYFPDVQGNSAGAIFEITPEVAP